MASGLSVVATRVGGVPEVVIENVTGYLTSPHQPELLADRVCSLYGNEDLRIDFGKKGREVVEQHFGMKRMTQELEELYRGVLENTRSR